MKKPRIIVNFSRYSDANFEIKVREIAANYEASIYFDKPTPTVAELLEALSAFTDALTATAGGDRFKIIEKNKCRKELEAVLAKMAGYATMVAADDNVKLSSLGYDMAKDAEPQEILPVEIVKITSGPNSGEVIVKVSGAKGAKIYTYEYTLDPVTDSSKWEGEMDSKTKHGFKELKPAVKYCFRVGVIGKGGVIIYSHIVTYIVQ